MIGDYWVSNDTGNVYEVGPRGRDWRVVGHIDDLEGFSGIAALLGFLGAALGLGLVAAVFAAGFAGLLIGAALVFIPAALPFSIPLLLLLLLVVAVRALATRRRLGPVLRALAAFAVLLVVAVLDVVYWLNGDTGLYITVASLPLMPVLTALLAIRFATRRRWALTALLLGQSAVFTGTYVASVGSGTYQDSSTGVDNVLALAYWLCVTCVVAAWLTPRRGVKTGFEPVQHAPAEVSR